VYLISQKWLETNCRKNYKNNLRSTNHEVFTAVARCSPNILDVYKALENVKLSSDKIGRLSLWSNETEVNFCHQSIIYVFKVSNF
jgi:hypothetical protein